MPRNLAGPSPFRQLGADTAQPQAPMAQARHGTAPSEPDTGDALIERQTEAILAVIHETSPTENGAIVIHLTETLLALQFAAFRIIGGLQQPESPTP